MSSGDDPPDKPAVPPAAHALDAGFDAPAFSDGANEIPDLAVEDVENVEPPGLRELTADDLDQALPRLEDPLRSALTLAYREGLSYQQIAARLDIPVNLVGARILRARRRLRELLAAPRDELREMENSQTDLSQAELLARNVIVARKPRNSTPELIPEPTPVPEPEVVSVPARAPDVELRPLAPIEDARPEPAAAAGPGEPACTTPEACAFVSLTELRAVQARLGEQRRKDTDTAAFWDAVEDFVRRGAATGVVIDNEDERWTVQGVLDYWAAALERHGRPRRDSSLAEFDPELAPELPDAICPYLGLNPFQERDSRMFFGRDALVDKVVRQLGEHRLVALVGPSGCGKSALAFAGLAGRLRGGALPGSEAWTVLAMVPGSEPRATLAGLLEPTAQGTEDSAPVLLIVDQFEELFTLCRSEAERAGFTADLLALVTQASPAHRVV